MNELEFEPRLRQLVDWSAAAWAALIGGTLFLLINLILTTTALDGNPWIVIRLIASIVMGDGVLAPPATFDAGILAVALVIHYVLSFVFAAVLVFALHRWGLIVGILGGAVMGLFLFAINFLSFTYFFPQFFAMATWVMVLSHVLFGASVGGIYEALEVVVYVTTDGERVTEEA
ncbi:MAG: hypothetical protein LJE93_04835 [Acidobacteria bacterium]|jgi:hypothetical protein|nr:hypothetical protein [Acidobacteriota bacterium]